MTTVDASEEADPVEKAHADFAKSLVGIRVANRYVVESILGTGGMGLVAAAHYPELDQPVAVKFMWPEHSAHHILAARFLREAKLAARVHSPHLVRVFDVGNLESGVPYLVMERLDGRDVGDELRERAEIPISEIVDWILQAASGLAELHTQGIVHRDLKPSNLFLAETASGRVLKVLDFGISKDKASTKATTLTAESVLGTPFYMSPEQVKDPKDVDPRSDVWSLGVILYELMTRELPFKGEGDSVGELFGRILFTEPVAAKRQRPDLPAMLDATIMKCLQRAREDRFANVAELAEALRPFAPAESAHRVDAIAKALKVGPISSREVVPVSEPRLAAAKVATEPTAAQGSGHSQPKVAARSAPSTQSAWDTKAKAIPNRRRTWIVLGGVGAGVITLAALLGVYRGRDDAKTTAAIAPPGSSPAAPPATVAAPPASAPEPALASTAISIPAGAASSVPAASAQPAASVKQRPLVTGGAIVRPPTSAHATTTATGSKPPDLVLDRK